MTKFSVACALSSGAALALALLYRFDGAMFKCVFIVAFYALAALGFLAVAMLVGAGCIYFINGFVSGVIKTMEALK